MLRHAVITAAFTTGTMLLAASCSSPAKVNASASSPSASASASSAPTAPSSTECAAVKAVVTGMMPQLKDGSGTIAQQAATGEQYYEDLINAIQQNGGTDPASTLVLREAQLLEGDFSGLASAGALAVDPSASTVLQEITNDLGQLTTDEAQFDQDCGIPTIVPS